jgi:hypothetical protein
MGSLQMMRMAFLALFNESVEFNDMIIEASYITTELNDVSEELESNSPLSLKLAKMENSASDQ